MRVEAHSIKNNLITFRIPSLIKYSALFVCRKKGQEVTFFDKRFSLPIPLISRTRPVRFFLMVPTRWVSQKYFLHPSVVFLTLLSNTPFALSLLKGELLNYIEGSRSWFDMLITNEL
jgi:hypothetical protein